MQNMIEKREEIPFATDQNALLHTLLGTFALR